MYEQKLWVWMEVQDALALSSYIANTLGAEAGKAVRLL